MSTGLNRQLADLRRAASISQEDLALKLGRRRGWVSQIEQGILDIKAKEALAWADICCKAQGPVPGLEIVVRQVLRCWECGGVMNDSPPGSGMFIPCSHFIK